MEWFIFALVGPLFWAVSNILDKYSIEKIVVGIADYAFFGSIGPILILTLIPFFFEIEAVPLFVMGVTGFGGFLLNYTYMTYGITLAHTDTSRVIPIFQLRTLVVLFAGWLFFEEVLDLWQLVGFCVALLGVLLLSIDFAYIKRPRLNTWGLVALCATFAFSIIILVNDFSVERMSVPSTLFYFDIGFLAASMSFLLVPSWRIQIFTGLRTATPKKFLLFFINDVADETAQACSKLALATAPAAALVTVTQGVQSFYVLLAGLILTTWFPNVTRENIEPRILIQKFLGAAIIFCGVSISVLL